MIIHGFSLKHTYLKEIETFYFKKKGARRVKVKGIDEDTKTKKEVAAEAEGEAAVEEEVDAEEEEEEVVTKELRGRKTLPGRDFWRYQDLPISVPFRVVRGSFTLLRISLS